jgi:hypothetical protein
LTLASRAKTFRRGAGSIASFDAQWRQVTEPDARKAGQLTAPKRRLDIRISSISDSGAKRRCYCPIEKSLALPIRACLSGPVWLMPI